VAISFVKHLGSVSINMGTSGTISVPAGGVAVGDLIVVRGTNDSDPTIALSDARGNTYTTRYEVTSNQYHAVATCVVTTALLQSDLITITVSKCNGQYLADQFTGQGTYETGTNATGAGTSASAGPVTPAAAGLIVGVLGLTGDGGTLTYDSDNAGGDTWHTLTEYASGGRSSMAQYKITTSAVSQTWNMSWANSKEWAIAALFWPAAATGGTGTFTANAVLKKSQSSSFTANAVIKRNSGTLTFTANAVIKRTQTGTPTANAVIKRTITPTTTANAVLFKNSGTKTFTADATIRVPRTGSLTADAIVKRTQAQSLTADSVVFGTRTGSFSADAVIKKTMGIGETVVIEAADHSIHSVVSYATDDPDTAMEHGTLISSADVPDYVDIGYYAGLASLDVFQDGPPYEATATEAFLAFDLSTIGFPVAGAVLSLWSNAAFVTSYPQTEARAYDFGTDVELTDWVDGSDLAGLPLLAHGDILYNGEYTDLTSDGLAGNIMAYAGGDGRLHMVVVGAHHVALDWRPSGMATVGLVGAAVDTIRPLLRVTGVDVGFTADAVIRKAQTGSLSADAVVFRAQTGSFSANAVIRVGAAASFTADAVVFASIAGSFTADATITGGAVMGGFTADAVINSVSRCIWTTPGNLVQISSTETLAFYMPEVAAGDMHFQIEIDTADDFPSPVVWTSHSDLAGWEYWDGDSWESVPQGGVPNTYCGNEARYTIQTPLSEGTYYRRVRAGVI
jgi:hypothetical protein